MAERVAERSRKAEAHEFVRLSGVGGDEQGGSLARAAAKKHGVPHAALGDEKIGESEEEKASGVHGTQPDAEERRGRKVRVGEATGHRRRFLPGWIIAFFPILLVGGIVFGVCYFAMRPMPEPRPRSGSVRAEGPSTLWSPGSSKELTSLGSDGEAKGRTISAQAVASARQAADRNPGDAQAQHNAGVAAQMLGDAGAARSYYLRALAISPQAVRTAFNLAQLEFEEGNYAAAAVLYAKLRKAVPSYRVLAYRSLICTLLMGGAAEVDESVLSEDTVPGLYARAAVAWKARDAERARDYVRRAREMGSKNEQHFEADLLLLGYFDG